MLIEQSSVALASSRYAASVSEQRVSARAWVGERPAGNGAAPQGAAPASGVAVALSAESRRVAAAAVADTSASSAPVSSDPFQDAIDADPKLRALIALIERLTGRKVRLLHVSVMSAESQAQAASLGARQAQTARQADAPQLPNWGAEIHTERTTVEVEQTSFAATGQVETADGRTISFDLQVGMSREYVGREATTVLFGNAVRPIDPLAVSLDAGPATLESGRFEFDLDRDGTAESIARPGANTAFLALDRNANGTIDDGSELFGPATGDGFAELAAFDSDGNGWIEAGDPVYARLTLWTGKDTTQSAGDAGIGAIFVGRVGTEFGIRGLGNEDLGQVRASGVYLTEDGVARPVQQVDLTA